MRRSDLTGRCIATGTGLVLAGCLAAAAAAQAPAALERLSEIPMGNLNAVALAGDRVYAGLGPRLMVLDAAAAEGLRVVGQGSTHADDLLELAVDPARPDRLWAAAGEAGVLHFDVGDPARPQLLGRLPGYASRLRAIGGRVYALGVGSDLRILEPHGAEGLRELGRVELPIEAFDVEGDLLWLAVGPAGLVAYDIADPARPRPVGALDTPGSAHDIQVEGGLAFVADGGRRLSVVDLSDPAAPALIGSLEVDLSAEQQCADPVGGDCGLDARRVLVQGGRLVLVLWRYLGAFSGRSAARMVLVDIADPRAPREIARRGFRGQPVALAMDDRHILAAEHPLWWYAGIAPCQLAPGGLGRYGLDLVPSGDWEPPAAANAVALWDGHAWLADPVAEWRSFDLAEPQAPKPAAKAPRAVYGSHYGSAEIRDLVVDEGGARLVRGSQSAGFLGQQHKSHREADRPGLRRQPGRPQNGCSPPPRTEWFHRIASDGRRDYLLDQADGLQVFEPGAFRPVSRIEAPATHDLAAHDGWVLLATDQGPRVLDARDPAAVREVAALPLPGYQAAVAWSDDGRLAALGGEAGWALLDLGRPERPALLARLALPDPVLDLALGGSHAYLLGAGELLVLDIHDPRAPRLLLRHAIAHRARRLALGGDLLALLSESGLELLRARPPDDPPLLPSPLYLPRLFLP